jgi:hypothetical protein
VQFANALSPIVVKLRPSTICLIAVQPSNADAPILESALPVTTEVNLIQSLNAEAPMPTTETGTFNVPAIPLQPSNALLGIVSTFSPKVRLVMFVLPVIPLSLPKLPQFIAL